MTGPDKGVAEPVQGRSPRQRRTLVVHVGDHKTGTTTIQSGLSKGVIKLEGAKLYYPSTNLEGSHNHLAGAFLSLANPSNSRGGATQKELLSQLGEELRGSNARFKVVSAENLAPIDPDGFLRTLQELFSDSYDDIRIVAYVRPHAQRVLSYYSECTKIGTLRQGNLNTFFDKSDRRGMLNYHRRFSEWKRVFGDQFVLRPFVRSELLDGSIMADFSATAFGDAVKSVTEPEARNESLTLEDLMRVKFVQKELADAQYNRHALGWSFQQVLKDIPSNTPGTPLRMHRKLAERIREAYLEDATKVDEEFFGGKNLLRKGLDDAVESASEKLQSGNPRDYFDESELRSLRLVAQSIMMFSEKNQTPSFVRLRTSLQSGGPKKTRRAAWMKQAKSKLSNVIKSA